MDYGTVGTGAMVSLIIMAVFGIILPIVAAVVWVVKTKEKISTVLIGAGIFILFALILESIPKSILFGNTTALSNYIVNHAWAFTLAAAGLAGIFEETGRWIAFKFFRRKSDDKKTAISYGIGHGGIEVVIILGISAVTYLIYAIMINQGVFGLVVADVAAVSPEQVSAIEALAQGIVGMNIKAAALACVERIFAVIFHISCSVLVFKSVKEKGAWYYFPLAIVLHGGLDAFAALYQFGVIENVIYVELLIGFFACVVAFIASRVYKNMQVCQNQ